MKSISHSFDRKKKIKLLRTSVGNDVEQSEFSYAACEAFNPFGKQLDNIE